MWSRTFRAGDVLVVGEARVVVQELADGTVRLLIDAPLHVLVRRERAQAAPRFDFDHLEPRD